MKGSKKVIDALNTALANEMVAINQYIMHARMTKNRGYVALAARIEQEAMDEMRHAEALIDRILFLEGTPSIQPTKNAQIGQTVTQMLQNDASLEQGAIDSLNQGIEAAREEGDDASAELLRRILLDEEKHLDWNETQLRLIEKLGENAYLQTTLRA